MAKDHFAFFAGINSQARCECFIQSKSSKVYFKMILALAGSFQIAFAITENSLPKPSDILLIRI